MDGFGERLEVVPMAQRYGGARGQDHVELLLDARDPRDQRYSNWLGDRRGVEMAAFGPQNEVGYKTRPTRGMKVEHHVFVDRQANQSKTREAASTAANVGKMRRMRLL